MAERSVRQYSFLCLCPFRCDIRFSPPKVLRNGNAVYKSALFATCPRKRLFSPSRPTLYLSNTCREMIIHSFHICTDPTSTRSWELCGAPQVERGERLMIP